MPHLRYVYRVLPVVYAKEHYTRTLIQYKCTNSGRIIMTKTCARMIMRATLLIVLRDTEWTWNHDVVSHAQASPCRGGVSAGEWREGFGGVVASACARLRVRTTNNRKQKQSDSHVTPTPLAPVTETRPPTRTRNRYVSFGYGLPGKWCY